jgi:hypothetical protein
VVMVHSGRSNGYRFASARAKCRKHANLPRSDMVR